ncbi:cytochrome d ubiquinol oxidase subunit II [Sporolactobacillus spathodeae]|uniref:cytochrome d ubiquinol oxidase subunit II n=1 Tax=Sporolactobacillus spathodeae TaxID=1465502 RepID=UPI0019608303
MLLLSNLWFLLIAVLFIGFFVLEGYDYGVGMATRFVAHNKDERTVLNQAIGPFWDANEVWMITAGGAMFAAFPNWYATLFSGFYVPLVLMLFLLIGRGTAFEFRIKIPNSKWTATWDWLIFVAGLLAPFLWGVVFSTLVQGLPIDKNMNMHAGFFDIVNGYSVLGGLLITLLCLYHGLVFLTLRVTGDLRNRARTLAKKIFWALAVVALVFIVASYFATDIFARRGTILVPVYLLDVVVLFLSLYFLSKERDGWAIGMNAGVILLTVSSLFIGLFPRVMVSSIKPAYDLTVTNASSGNYSLTVMTIVTICLLPFVLAYTIWSYYAFRKRVTSNDTTGY